ncbi:hypothetical protein [Mycoplasma hafezii]|uniref:hypothetical protein n=1 Tax=Mycoplasma hafezii TaxID=525886 RepID=UPI003CF9CAAC
MKIANLVFIKTYLKRTKKIWVSFWIIMILLFLSLITIIWINVFLIHFKKDSVENVIGKSFVNYLKIWFFDVTNHLAKLKENINKLDLMQKANLNNSLAEVLKIEILFERLFISLFSFAIIVIILAYSLNLANLVYLLILINPKSNLLVFRQKFLFNLVITIVVFYGLLLFFFGLLTQGYLNKMLLNQLEAA